MAVIMVKNSTEGVDALPFGMELLEQGGRLLTLLGINVSKSCTSGGDWTQGLKWRVALRCLRRMLCTNNVFTRDVIAPVLEKTG